MDCTAPLENRHWAQVSKHMPESSARSRGRPSTPDRDCFEAFLWLLAGSQREWECLPKGMPSRAACTKRLEHWRRLTSWESIMQTYLRSLDDQTLMVLTSVLSKALEAAVGSRQLQIRRRTASALCRVRKETLGWGIEEVRRRSKQGRSDAPITRVDPGASGDEADPTS
ncbi:transposase [Pseudobythopirellula maris]|uniref:transposase n=1 Tax=Pseudobythopirellula maris TaxID=2527991 RepID=UPI003704A50D